MKILILFALMICCMTGCQSQPESLEEDKAIHFGPNPGDGAEES